MSMDITRLGTEEQVEKILANPDLCDRLGTADLKRVVKFLARLTNNVGTRAGQHQRQALDLDLTCEVLRSRIAELVGSKPPAWSYLHKEEALRLHVFSGFSTVTDEHAVIVCGEEDGALHPIYEYDFDDHGKTLAAEAAQSMLVHLRQTFTPRTKEIPHERATEATH